MFIPFGSGDGFVKNLDVSGNAMGDIGTIGLAKALQVDESLRRIAIDRNGVTLRGLEWIKLALSRNSTLLNMEIPHIDIELERNDEKRLKMWTTMSDIEKILWKNNLEKENSQRKIQRNESEIPTTQRRKSMIVPPVTPPTKQRLSRVFTTTESSEHLQTLISNTSSAFSQKLPVYDGKSKFSPKNVPPELAKKLEENLTSLSEILAQVPASVSTIPSEDRIPHTTREEVKHDDFDDDYDESNKVIDKTKKISVKSGKKRNPKRTTAPTTVLAKGKYQKKKTVQDGREKPTSYRPRPGSQYMTAPPSFTEIETDAKANQSEKEPENKAQSETDRVSVEVVDKN